MIAGPDDVAGDIVDVAQHTWRCVVAFGNLAECFATCDFVPGPANLFGNIDGSECRARAGLIGDRNQNTMGAIGIRCPAVDAGIQFVHGINGEATEFGSQCDINLAFRFDRGEVGLVVDDRQRDLERLGRCHQVTYCEKFWHVARSFLWQVLANAPEVGAKTGCFSAPDGTCHIAFAGIVAGDCQQPVTVEALVQLLQVIECCTGRIDDVAATVVPPVLLQAQPFAGAGNDLPETRGAPVRIGKRIECALDDRQQRQIAGHAAFFECFGDVMQVAAGAPEHTLNVFRVAAIPGEFCGDIRVLGLWQFKFVGQPCDQIWRRSGYGFQRGRLRKRPHDRGNHNGYCRHDWC